ncbi:MAG: hypothetical protein ABW133_25060 [Polyangiaceae bacterium]
MNLDKVTTLLVVDRIEPCQKTWEKVGYQVTVRVPETGDAGFVIMKGKSGELMMQTRASLADDLPAIAAKKPSYVLYADVASIDAAKKALAGAKVVIEERKTFYGAKEAWLELEGGTFIGLAEHEK